MSSDLSRIASRVVEYVEDNYADRISLRDVAATFGYSAAHLTTQFREATGMPVTSWIVKRRITAAQKVLSEKDLSVASVCEMVGFNDVRYFTRQFVRHIGVTPGRFRSTMNPKRREAHAGPAR
jgi:two-component system, response regulator YesN